MTQMQFSLLEENAVITITYRPPNLHGHQTEKYNASLQPLYMYAPNLSN
jgi:hypothetical protein